jgi:S1-C subfamily serine protease
LAVTLPAAADNQLDRLPDSLLELPLLNGPEMRRALNPMAARLLPSSGWLEDSKGRPLVAVTFVGSEGYFVTKASEVFQLERGVRLRRPGSQQTFAVRQVRRDPKLDLVLAQVIPDDDTAAEVFQPVPWAATAPKGLGQWLCAPALDTQPAAPPEPRPVKTGPAATAPVPHLKLGVISAARRAIEGFGAALGISMAPRQAAEEEADATEERLDPNLPGILIRGVADDSPAQKAGVQGGDILLEVAGQKVNSLEGVNALVKKREPGEEIQIKLEREGEPLTKRVRLASRSRVMANFAGDDYANGGVSIRTDNYAEVLQHDLPLNPIDMGGPLFDLEGRAIGINIARVDRITTFALPVETFRATLDAWLEADRHPPAAERVRK